MGTITDADICAKYEAQAEIVSIDRGFRLEVLNTVPADAAVGLLVASVAEIQRAVGSVLEPRGIGAIVFLRNFHIHDVDCNPRVFGQLTVAALENALGAD